MPLKPSLFQSLPGRPRLFWVLSLVVIVIASFWLLFGESLVCMVSAGCGPGDPSCPSNCCLHGPIVGRKAYQITSCKEIHPGVCSDSGIYFEYACPVNGAACKYSFDRGICTYQHTGYCHRESYTAVIGCCSSAPEPTKTQQPNPTNPPPPTATRTPTPEPLTVNLRADYGALLFMAPKLGQPTQILRGSVSGGTPPYAVNLRVRKPSGITITYMLGNASSIVVTANNTGDPYFGVDQEGEWTAWAESVDSNGFGAASLPVTWYVSFYPVHQKP